MGGFQDFILKVDTRQHTDCSCIISVAASKLGKKWFHSVSCHLFQCIQHCREKKGRTQMSKNCDIAQ